MTRSHLAACFLELSAAAASLSAAAAPQGLCVAKETVFFACQTTKQRWIAVCGSPPESLQYRYGSSSSVEFAIPKTPAMARENSFSRTIFVSKPIAPKSVSPTTAWITPSSTTPKTTVVARAYAW